MPWLLALFAGLPGEIAAEEAAGDAGKGEEPGHFAVGTEDEDEDVGAAGDRERDRRGVDEGHTEDPKDAKVQEPRRDKVLRSGGKDHGGWMGETGSTV
jgi:hypothetical protein